MFFFFTVTAASVLVTTSCYNYLLFFLCNSTCLSCSGKAKPLVSAEHLSLLCDKNVVKAEYMNIWWWWGGGGGGFLICCYLSYVFIVASLCFHEVIRFRLKLRHMS